MITCAKAVEENACPLASVDVPQHSEMLMIVRKIKSAAFSYKNCGFADLSIFWL